MQPGTWRLVPLACSLLMIVQPAIGAGAGLEPDAREQPVDPQPAWLIGADELLQRTDEIVPPSIPAPSMPGLPGDLRPALKAVGPSVGWEASAPSELIDRPALRPGSGSQAHGPDVGPASSPSSSPSLRVNETLEREDHPTIVIVGDRGPTGFALAEDPRDGEPIPRPGSGVRSGDGSADNPYVISGWNVSGIIIQDTDAHVIIRNNTIHPAPEVSTPSDPTGRFGALPEDVELAEGAVDLEDADNVQVRSNRFPGEQIGIQASHADGLTIAGNRFERPTGAILALQSEDVRIEEHTFRPRDANASDLPPILADRVQDLTVEGNRFEGGSIGLAVNGSKDVQLTDNAFVDVEIGTFLNATLGTDAEQNRFTRNVVSLVHLGEGTVTLERNEFTRPIFGVLVDGDALTVAFDNTFEEALIGMVALHEAHGIALQNTFAGTSLAIAVDDAPGWVLASNTIQKAIIGILSSGEEARIVSNRIDASAYGLVIGGERSEIRSNRIDAGLVGAYLFESHVTSLTDNRIEGELVGTYAYASVQLDVDGNRFPTGLIGLALVESPHASLAENRFTGNGLVVDGAGPSAFAHEIDASNTVNGDPIRYMQGTRRHAVEQPAGQVILANTTAAGLHGLSLEDAYAPIQIADANHTRLENVSIRGAQIGVSALRTDGTTFEHVRIDGNASDPFGSSLGVLAWEGSNVSIGDTNVTRVPFGIALAKQTGAQVNDTVVREASIGLFSLGGSGLTAERNRLATDDFGLVLWGTPHGSFADNALEEGSLLVLGSDPFSFFGDLEGAFEQQIAPSNTVNGDPIRYAANEPTADVQPPAGQVFLVNVTRSEVRNVDVEDTTLPVFTQGVEELTVTNSRMTGDLPLIVDGSRNVTLNRNEITGTAGAHVDDAETLLVEDNVLTGGPNASIGFESSDTANGTFVDNRIEGFPIGVLVDDGGPHSFKVNELHDGGFALFAEPGVRHKLPTSNTVNGEPARFLWNATDARVSEPAGQVIAFGGSNLTVQNVSVPRSTVGVHLRDVHEARVEGVEANSTVIGVAAERGSNVTVADGEVRNASAGVFLLRSDSGLVTGTRVIDGAGSFSFGIIVEASGAQVTRNTVMGTTIGLELDTEDADDEPINATRNRIEENEYGIDALFSDAAPEIHRNNIVDNEEAGLVPSAFNVTDARRNWWGCAAGPGEPGCDEVLGFGVGQALVEPWLTEPVQDAGAGGQEGSDTSPATSTSERFPLPGIVPRTGLFDEPREKDPTLVRRLASPPGCLTSGGPLDPVLGPGSPDPGLDAGWLIERFAPVSGPGSCGW